MVQSVMSRAVYLALGIPEFNVEVIGSEETSACGVSLIRRLLKAPLEDSAPVLTPLITPAPTHVPKQRVRKLLERPTNAPTRRPTRLPTIKPTIQPPYVPITFTVVSNVVSRLNAASGPASVLEESLYNSISTVITDGTFSTELVHSAAYYNTLGDGGLFDAVLPSIDALNSADLEVGDRSLVNAPTSVPTTSRPTSYPSERPVTSRPTRPGDTNFPTIHPTSSAPTSLPTGRPTGQPTSRPSAQPTAHPSNPSSSPTSAPSYYGLRGDQSMVTLAVATAIIVFVIASIIGGFGYYMKKRLDADKSKAKVYILDGNDPYDTYKARVEDGETKSAADDLDDRSAYSVRSKPGSPMSPKFKPQPPVLPISPSERMMQISSGIYTAKILVGSEHPKNDISSIKARGPETFASSAITSLTQTLDELESTVSLRKSKKRAKKLNHALIHMTPDSTSDNCLYVMNSTLQANNIKVVASGKAEGFELHKIVEQELSVFKHYAETVTPDKYLLSDECISLFEQSFGINWEEAVKKGMTCNATDACDFLSVNVEDLYDLHIKASNTVRLCQGLHCTAVKYFDDRANEKVAIALKQKKTLQMRMLAKRDEEARDHDELVIRRKELIKRTVTQAKEDIFSKPKELVDERHMSVLYVFNGFYPSLRRKYMAPQLVLNFVVVEWDGAELSWADFLVDVIGHKDPKLAFPFSIRGHIFSSWQSLGLAAEPSKRDNCVHASSSAFEGLVERLLWVKNALIFTDVLGSRLITQHNIPSQLLKEWCETNPFVNKKRITDYMHLLDCDACCIAAESLHSTVQAKADYASPTKPDKLILPAMKKTQTEGVFEKRNKSIESSFIFIKPGGSQGAIMQKVLEILPAFGVRVIKQGAAAHKDLSSYIFDIQYKFIAERAIKKKPSDLMLSQGQASSFEGLFKTSWQDAIGDGILFNNAQLIDEMGLSNAGIYHLWIQSTKVLRLAKGFYIAEIELPFEYKKFILKKVEKTKEEELSTDTTKSDGFAMMNKYKKGASKVFPATDTKEPIKVYLINGFYGSMRDIYFSLEMSIPYLCVEWDSDEMSYEYFMAEVIGNKDPEAAKKTSIRGAAYASCFKLGFRETLVPSARDNVIHASASSFEAMVERLLWAKGSMLFTDLYGQKLLAQRFQSSEIKHWISNPIINGDYLFAHLYRKSGDEVLELLKRFSVQ